MNEQLLRPHSTFTIAITSGKGGVGKSSIALNLAIQIAQLEAKVLLIDADMGLANVSILLGIEPENTLEDVIEGSCDIFDAMVDAPEGVVIIPAVSGTGRHHILTPWRQETLRKKLGKVESGFDLILIDTGPGMSPNVTALLTFADEILVVTTPEPTAIADAYAMIKVICNTGQPIKRIKPINPINPFNPFNRLTKLSVLINMVGSGQEAEDLKAKFDQMVERFLNTQVEDRGYVLTDRSVAEAVSRQVPFVIGSSDCPASKCLRELAKKMLLSIQGNSF